MPIPRWLPNDSTDPAPGSTAPPDGCGCAAVILVRASLTCGSAITGYADRAAPVTGTRSTSTSLGTSGQQCWRSLFRRACSSDEQRPVLFGCFGRYQNHLVVLI